MGDFSKSYSNHPPEQAAIRAKCFHPTGNFVEFKKEEIEQSIPDRFEKIVGKYADRIAIKTKDHALTYDELNKAANRVARTILAQRENGEAPVALLLDHDASVIAGILGVLKAAKTYVPLEPSYPQARTRYILEDTQATLILTNSRNLVLANELARDRCQVINVDEIDINLSDANLDTPISPDDFAYVLYTSGSTGQPKGVVQNHRNVLYLIMNLTNALHICSDDRMTLLYSGSVSGAVKDIFGALLNGASVLPFDLKEEGVGNLATWLVQEEISIYHSVSTVFRHVLDSLSGEEKFPRLRIVTLGGESVSTREVEAYKKYFPKNCILHSVLGSTELNSVCHYFIDKETQINGNTVPAGYAVEGTELLLLDDAGETVGSDCIGEIAFRSHYLTPGYWRKPELMPSIFLPDPEGGDARIYRTGDLGRKSIDGCLEYLGRKDSQVKTRGYRVELAEIEMVLLTVATIKEAAVVAREDQPGDHRLVAYIVSTGNPAPTVSALRRILSEKLPDHMIPSVFICLAALPLTPNGKVDRRALPPVTAIRQELDTPFVAPRTLVEETLAGVWSEVLGVDQVGIHDNFFDLGGHSLAATRIVSQVIKKFQLELPLKSLFQSPTIAEMASVITENRARKLEQTDLQRILTELESLSDEDAKKLLAGQDALAGIGKQP